MALVPMFLHPWNGRRQVTFLGNGVSDYLDILADCGVAHQAWPLILQHLAEQRDRWDLCDLQDLSESSPLIDSRPSPPLQCAVRPQFMYSVVALPDTASQFEGDLPHGLRRNLRRYRTHLQGQGQVSFGTADESDFEEYMAALFALHRARWQERDNPGMLQGPGLERFHAEAARNLWNEGLVRLYALRLDQRIIAVVYALIHRQRAYSYLGGFDPEFARFSPGTLIMAYTIEQAILEGVRDFDFLRGREAYKSDWGAQARVSSRLILWHDRAPTDLLESTMA